MKKRFLSLLIAAMICGSMVGCGKSSNNTTNTQNKSEVQQKENNDKALKGKKMSFKEMGIEYYTPEAWVEKENVGPICVIPGKYGVAYIVGEIPYEFIPNEFLKELIKKSENAKTEEEQAKLFEEYQSKSKELFDIIVLDKNKEKDGPKEDIERKEKVFTQYKNHEKVAEIDNLECYILYNDEYDENGLSEEEKKEFKEVRNGIEELKKNVKLFTPVDPNEKMASHKSIEFKAKTLDGNDIDNSIFKDNDITMVNIWATFCGPCKAEMPDLQELYEEIKEENMNVTILGIVSDALDDENQELARKIVDAKGVKFINIIPDDKLQNSFLKDVSGVPTTIFVDSDGNIVGDPIVGSRSKEDYKQTIIENLNSLNK